MPIAACHARRGAALAAFDDVGNDAQVGLVRVVELIEDMARDRAEAAAESGGLRRRQTLAGNGDHEMIQERLAQCRKLAVAKRLGQIEAMNFRAERGAGRFDANVAHDHSAMTSAASL